MTKIKVFKSLFISDEKSLLFYVHLVIELKKTGFNQSHLKVLQKFHNYEQPKITLDVIRLNISKD